VEHCHGVGSEAFYFAVTPSPISRPSCLQFCLLKIVFVEPETVHGEKEAILPLANRNTLIYDLSSQVDLTEHSVESSTFEKGGNCIPIHGARPFKRLG
jgi:hypothetical protein